MTKVVTTSKDVCSNDFSRYVPEFLTMYEYFNLTPQERSEILRIRKSQGYPLHAPPHPFRDEGYFLVTAATYQHAHILKTAERRTNFEVSLLHTFQELEADVKAWVVLPNHYHILVYTPEFGRIARSLKLLHGRTSREWNLADSTSGRKVWYRYSDRKMRGERHYYAALNYIHYNSVKHKWVGSWRDWPWSSFPLYEKDYGPEWINENWQKYPVEDFGKGWDDSL